MPIVRFEIFRKCPGPHGGPGCRVIMDAENLHKFRMNRTGHNVEFQIPLGRKLQHLVWPGG